ncbi:MAG TPA: GDSL-type esterase/lipase family protein [Kofleriaceae bacterium]|nr:GDSL-type esterase/lipase family protein [Kofleriaceae bacterium]
MSEPDRSWTIAPVLGWFGVVLIAGLFAIDGDLSALADRLTAKRETAPSGGAGPVFEAGREPPGDDSELIATLPPPPAGSHDIGALDDVCIEPAAAGCKRWAMDGFYRAVAAAQAGTLGRPLRVSWYGDSVIANDTLPGRLRERFQAELGDGGPGFVYALAPHRFCEHEAITRGGGDDWSSYAISMAHTGDGFYGPGGASHESWGGRASIKLVHGTVSRAELYYLAQPHGGTASVTADGTEIVHVDTRADAKQAGWALGTIAQGASKLEISGRGRVRVFGLVLENERGAVVDNLGIVSMQVKSFGVQDDEHFAAELAHRGADLILVMLGANEAQYLTPGRAMRAYEAQYEDLLATIRKARPDGSCLVMSPTDQAEAKDGRYASRPVIAAIVDAQRKAAHAQGCAFYSTYDWMGGKGSAVKWFRRHQVSGDFIHLTIAGADKLADGLYTALMKGAHAHASK